jgi:hypothetical protein
MTLLKILAHPSSFPIGEFPQETPAHQHCFRILLTFLLCSRGTGGFCKKVQHDDIASDSWSSFFFARCRIFARNSSPSILLQDLAHISSWPRCRVPARNSSSSILLQDLAHISSLPAVEFLQESPLRRHCFRFLLIFLLCLQ